MPIEFHRDGPWELPRGWVWARLGHLGHWSGGGTPSKANASFWTNGTIPWVSPKDMKVDVIGDTEDYITPAAVANSTTKIIGANSVLMVVRSGILKHTFPVVLTDRAVTINQDLRALSPSQVIEARYLVHFLRRAQRFILDECSKDGTTVASVEPALLERMWVPIAPIAEQRRIVSEIDKLFIEIADGETALLRAHDDLETWRRALLKAAVTGKLTNGWRGKNKQNETGLETVEPIRQKLQGLGVRRRARRTGGAAAFTIDELPEVPPHWQWTPLGELTVRLTSGSRDWAEYYDKGTGVFVLAQNVRPGRYNHSVVQHVDPPSQSSDAERARIQRNDLLITIVGANTGDVCQIDFDPVDHYVCQSVALLRLADPRIASFVAHVLMSEVGQMQFRRFIYGAGRPHLSFDQIESVLIPIPPLAECEAIVDLASTYMSEVSDAAEFMNDAHATARALRRAALRAAFEGRLCEQNVDDEPAANLLSRINDALTPSPTNADCRPRHARGRAKRASA